MLPDLNMVRESLTGMGAEARSYAERIIARLESIHRAVESQDFDEHRMFVPLTLTADTETELATIPNGAEWMLETVAVLTACAVTINADGRFVFAKEFTTADTVMVNLVLPRGGVLSIISDGADVRVNVQLKQRISATPRAARSGFINPEPTPGTATSPLETHRHGTA